MFLFFNLLIDFFSVVQCLFSVLWILVVGLLVSFRCSQLFLIDLCYSLFSLVLLVVYGMFLWLYLKWFWVLKLNFCLSSLCVYVMCLLMCCLYMVNIWNVGFSLLLWIVVVMFVLNGVKWVMLVWVKNCLLLFSVFRQCLNMFLEVVVFSVCG